LYAIILAGGRGKRLRPITDYVPKPLIPLNNIPIIEWQIKYLKKHGIKKIIICTGYKSKIIENYLLMKNNFGIQIEFSIENTPLGTAGAIKKAGSKIKGTNFFVLNGDVITNIDLEKLRKNHNSIASIELKTQFGVLEIKGIMVMEFKEKTRMPNLWINAGIYYLQKDILKKLPAKGDIERTLFPKYAKQRKLNAIKFSNVLWYSIDSFKDMEQCSLELRRN
jgi:NDP-sugar pyrophosphorylase family protein